MRLRISPTLLSSVLFTVALVCLIPGFWANVLTHKDIRLAGLDDGYRAYFGAISDFSVASLAMILLVLIVVWAGYAKRARWAWFAMFIVVWGWAFPLLLLPMLRGRLDLTVAEWLGNAIDHPGSPRAGAELVLIFLAMVAALVLPIRSFLSVAGKPESTFEVTPRSVTLSLGGFLFAMAALLVWIRVGVVYQIPSTELNATQRLPAPIAPPGHNN